MYYVKGFNFLSHGDLILKLFLYQKWFQYAYLTFFYFWYFIDFFITVLSGYEL